MTATTNSFTPNSKSPPSPETKQTVTTATNSFTPNSTSPPSPETKTDDGDGDTKADSLPRPPKTKTDDDGDDTTTKADSLPRPPETKTDEDDEDDGDDTTTKSPPSPKTKTDDDDDGDDTTTKADSPPPSPKTKTDDDEDDGDDTKADSPPPSPRNKNRRRRRTHPTPNRHRPPKQKQTTATATPKLTRSPARPKQKQTRTTRTTATTPPPKLTRSPARPKQKQTTTATPTPHRHRPPKQKQTTATPKLVRSPARPKQKQTATTTPKLTRPRPPKQKPTATNTRMAGENATKKNWARKKRMASWARQRQQITEAADGGARARTGADGAVVLNLRRGPGAYALLSRADGQLTRAGQHYYSHLGLRPPSKDFDYNQPLIREGPNDYILLRNGRKKLVRSLQGGEHRLTKLGKGFFRDKFYEYLVHVPVIIRNRRRSGRNAGAGYERRDWLPVNELGGATRPAHLTEEQVAQRVRQQVEASLDPGGPILQLSDETYFLDPEGHWVVSTQSTRYRNSRTEVETLLRQRMRGLRSVSFQLPCEEDVLPSAFEDKPLCVPRQLAELLQLSVEEVCADFDAMLRLVAPRHLRRGGARVLRVAQRPDARAELAGRPRGQLRPGAEGAPHRVLLGLRRALLHVQGREAGAGEAGGARALPGRGEADPAAHPRVEALRRRGRAAGAVLVRGPAGGAAPAHGRRREPQGGHQQPGAVLRAEAEAGHQDPRAAGGGRGAAEVVRGAQPGVPGPAPGRLGARDFFEAAQGETGGARRGGEAEDPSRAGRQVRAVRLRADGRLRAGPRGAGEAGLCGQRANSAGAVRRLPQREDAEGERAAHEFGEPRWPRRHGVRPEPQAAPSGF